ncbi:MAG: GNAT family N-acetyltransferase [Clostridia bacterium]|nr:GNAT family N-acetyltransferase [Clostridia bacterium]
MTEEKMKVLFGTTNESKLKTMRRMTEGLGIELIGLKDLKAPLPQVDESGDDILRNAELKARAYWQAFHIPVFSCDSGLFFDGLPSSLQPGTHIRRVNGKTLNDDEMIEYYASLAHSHGGALAARYRNAICFILDENTVFKSADDSLASEPFLLTDVPHPKREKGYPLDALSKDIKTGQYYYDLPESCADHSELGLRDFIINALRDTPGSSDPDIRVIQIGLDYYPACTVLFGGNCPFSGTCLVQQKAGNREAYALFVNGEIAAECHLVYDNPEYRTIPGKRAYFSRMVTRKEYRRRGYGETIARYILDLAKTKGYQEIALGVNCDNTAALQLYKKLGFTVYAEAEDDYGKYFRMEQTL